MKKVFLGFIEGILDRGRVSLPSRRHSRVGGNPGSIFNVINLFLGPRLALRALGDDARRGRNDALFMLILALPLSQAFAQQETAKYEQYLNGIKTLSGNFIQTNSRGQSATGEIQISRPGKMRLSYAPPSSLLIVANGKWLVTKDRQADEVDYVSLENTPAAFILRPQVRFKGDVGVTNVIHKDDNTTEISLIRTEDPEAGYITLVFEDNPLSLKGWKVMDAQGETRVVLTNMQPNVQLPAGLFRMEDPNLLQQIF